MFLINCVARETYLFNAWNEFHLKIRHRNCTDNKWIRARFFFIVKTVERSQLVHSTPNQNTQYNVHLGRFSDWKRQWHESNNNKKLIYCYWMRARQYRRFGVENAVPLATCTHTHPNGCHSVWIVAVAFVSLCIIVRVII